MDSLPRIEILWNYYCKRRKKHIEEWIPGRLLHTHSDGRKEVRADNGLYAYDAHPDCVREGGAA